MPTSTKEKTTENTRQKKIDQVNNSLTQLATGLFPGTPTYDITKTSTLRLNSDPNMISLDRNLLDLNYTKMGIVQTFIDVPVDDSFKGGIIINTEQIDADQLTELYTYLEEHNVINTIAQGIKFGRLYGGSAIIVSTDQNPSQDFNINSINKKSRLSFKVVDRWRLWPTNTYEFVNRSDSFDVFPGEGKFFYYRGMMFNRSRLFLFFGKTAPYIIKQRLAGWGMSEVERVIMSLNQYFKNQDVIFELLDEAKVDVFKIRGYAAELLTAQGTQNIDKMIRCTNQLKNFLNAVVLDSEDDYEQKTLNFAGLSDILEQIRIGVASDLRFSINKLFGLSSTGLNSNGEDALENYNSMIETEVRSKSKHQISGIIKIVCQKLFEFVPTDLTIDFPPLRVMSSEQEEIVKDKKYNRLILAVQNGLLGEGEFEDAVNKDDLLPIKLDPNKTKLEPPMLSGQDEEDKKEDKDKKDNS